MASFNATGFYDTYLEPILKATFGEKGRSGWLREERDDKKIILHFTPHREYRHNDDGHERAIALKFALTSLVLAKGIDCKIRRDGNTVTLTF